MNAPRPVIWLGWLFFAAFICAGFTTPAKADITYRIRCAEYSTAKGHRLALSSYIAYWDLDTTYTTEAACGDGADAWLAHSYHGNVLPDGARLLVQCWCERVR